MTDPMFVTYAGHAVAGSPDATRQALRDQAVQLEAFLFAQMLSVSGTGISAMQGGRESQFESMLQRQQAEAVAGTGQTGLAEAIYQSLARRAGVEG